MLEEQALLEKNKIIEIKLLAVYVIEKYERSFYKNHQINICLYKVEYWWINKYMNIYIYQSEDRLIKSKYINKALCN